MHAEVLQNLIVRCAAQGIQQYFRLPTTEGILAAGSQQAIDITFNEYVHTPQQSLQRICYCLAMQLL